MNRDHGGAAAASASPIEITSAPVRVAILAEPLVCPTLAADLVTRLKLVPITETDTPDYTHYLHLTTERLELREQSSGTTGPLYVDFVAGRAAHRRRFGGGRNQSLARAVGLKGGISPIVVDVTAGLGRDGFVLACLGCTVELVERSPIIAALLRDGLSRAVRDPEIGALVGERLRLVEADSREFLSLLPESLYPDVIYLDPMYPHRRKSALVKKEMRLLRQLIGDDGDAPDLLAIALTRAKRRVVVKRPRTAPPLAGPEPSFQIATPHTRFDIYPTNHH